VTELGQGRATIAISRVGPLLVIVSGALGLALTFLVSVFGCKQISGNVFKVHAECALLTLTQVAAEGRFRAAVTLFVIASAFSVACLTTWIVSEWRERGASSALGTFGGLLGAAALCFLARRWLVADLPSGPLTVLLKAYSLSQDSSVRRVVEMTRDGGHLVGLLLTLGAACLVSFWDAPLVLEIGARYKWYKRFLWSGSFLFVAGMFVTQANFSLLFAHAPLAPKAQHDAVETLRGSFLLEVGVGYSTNLLAVFAPIRVLLDWHFRTQVRSENRTLTLQDLGISKSWKEDFQDVLAILAPVLSIPALGALGNL
jgi:hypothetical protein